MLARHLSRYIPGAPAVVVRNMPGAGSARAAGMLFATAPKDGTAIAALYPGSIMGPLLDDRWEAHYDPARFYYIGSAESGARICATFHTSQVTTFKDAIDKPSIFAASAPGGSVHDYAFMLKKTTGAQYRTVVGYGATLDMTLAMERGEIDGLCGWDWSTAKVQKADWLRDRRVNLLLQVALEPDKQLAQLGVPIVWDFIKNEQDRNAVRVVASQQVFSRPYAAPPDTPAANVKTLRAGFIATMRDAQFLADAQKAGLDISPTAGEELQRLVESIFATPKATVEHAKRLIKP
jgi:tripartite-type tricarboxylate transporter receptor subunit TctC